VVVPWPAFLFRHIKTQPEPAEGDAESDELQRRMDARDRLFIRNDVDRERERGEEDDEDDGHDDGVDGPDHYQIRA
jgi:hypothetical protein